MIVNPLKNQICNTRIEPCKLIVLLTKKCTLLLLYYIIGKHCKTVINSLI